VSASDDAASSRSAEAGNNEGVVAMTTPSLHLSDILEFIRAFGGTT
jgi:hypothetical protein